MTRRYTATISRRDADATATDIGHIYRWAVTHWNNPQPLHLPIIITDPPAPLCLHCDTCTNTFPLTAADQLHRHTRHTHQRPPTRHERTPRT